MSQVSPLKRQEIIEALRMGTVPRRGRDRRGAMARQLVYANLNAGPPTYAATPMIQ